MEKMRIYFFKEILQMKRYATGYACCGNNNMRLYFTDHGYDIF